MFRKAVTWSLLLWPHFVLLSFGVYVVIEKIGILPTLAITLLIIAAAASIYLGLELMKRGWDV